MRLLRRPLSVAVAVLTILGALTGCGSDSGTDGVVTLHVVGWKGGGAEPANMAQVNAAFEKANPGIKLDFAYVPPNDVYQQKLQAQLLAGNAADVIMADPQKVQAWGKSGYLADLSQHSWVPEISPALKSFVTYQDKVLASPMELNPVGVYVNLDILAKAGITTPPTDFPAFLADLGKLKAAGLPGYSLPDKTGWMAEYVMLLSAATTVYQQTPDWDQQFMAGKVTFPESFQTPLRQIKQLGDDGYVDFAKAVGTDEGTTGQPDFIAGRSAFVAGGSWQADAMKKAGFKLAFIPWPGGEPGTSPSALLFPGTMWTINARSKQSAAAKTYVEFWAQSANLAPFLTAESALGPFRTSGASSDPLLGPVAGAYAAGRFTLFPTNTWNLADPETKIRSALQNFLLGKTDVAATLNTIQQAAKRP
jgi:raffinose/stachyose/melibiose transport system substrate-binding protein